MAIDCVIPAAGASTRMGDWKPLLPFGGSTIVETTVETALAAPIEGGVRVLLVAGYRGAELHRLFAGRAGITIVDNPGWEAGMLGSIQAALPLVGSGCFFIVHADMPLLPSAVYRILYGAAQAAERPLFASFRGEPGHPVLVPSGLIGGMLALDPAGKPRPFLMRRGGLLVDCDTPAVLADLDSRADYERAISERSQK